MLVTQKNAEIIGKTGNRIPAIYEQGEENAPIVLMAHGLQGSKNEYLDTQARISECLLEKYKIGSLRIDFYGHGDSENSLEMFSLTSQVLDMISGIEWLIREKKAKSIITLGISFGAPSAIIVTEMFKQIISKCVLIAPVVDFKKTFVFPMTNWGKTNFGYNRILEGIRDSGLALDKNYILAKDVLLDMLLMDIPAFVQRTSFDITIFHGNCDDMVPIDASKNLVSIRDNIKFIELDRTEHGLTQEGDEYFSTQISRDNLDQVVEEISL